MVTRTELHQIVDDLKDDEVDPAARLLKSLRDPLGRLHENAPEDDEEISEEE